MTIRARLVRLTATTALAVGAAGCATVTRGTSTAWHVQTTPAGAHVTTSNGRYCEATPCTISMPRKSDFTATLALAGYKTARVSVGNKISVEGGVGFVGNALIGGVLGAGVDLASGATLDLTPNPTIVALEREDGAGMLVAGAQASDAPGSSVAAAPPQVVEAPARAPAATGAFAAAYAAPAPPPESSPVGAQVTYAQAAAPPPDAFAQSAAVRFVAAPSTLRDTVETPSPAARLLIPPAPVATARAEPPTPATYVRTLPPALAEAEAFSPPPHHGASTVTTVRVSTAAGAATFETYDPQRD